MKSISQMYKVTGRAYLYLIILICQMLIFLQVAFSLIAGFYTVHVIKSWADGNIELIQSKLIPHLSKPDSHYHPIDIANMELSNSQFASEMLSVAQREFIDGALWLSIFLVLYIAVHLIFPDAKQLRKTELLPGKLKVLNRPIKFW